MNKPNDFASKLNLNWLKPTAEPDQYRDGKKIDNAEMTQFLKSVMPGRVKILMTSEGIEYAVLPAEDFMILVEMAKARLAKKPQGT